MKLSRPSRLIAACIALISMLCMQLAVASYICPGTPMGTASSMSAGMDQSDMTGCEGMDTAQPGLCHVDAHGETTTQSLDNPSLPDVQPFVPVGLVQALHVVEIASGPLATPRASISLTRTTAPPIAIRNCCFRI